MSSDCIVVNVLAPEVTEINTLTLGQGLINHSVTHQNGGSDELSHNLLGGLQGGSGGNYYHLTSGEYANLVTGVVVRPSDTGIFYPSSNPSGFITGVDLSGYVTGDVVRPSETGNFITTSQTGAFYAASNPSGFITGIPNIVYTTGNQDVSGLKDFQTRPTVADVPVLISGDAVETIHLYGKNDESFTLNKGQPVFINSANGVNPLISLASNTGERTSSKTIGLMAESVAPNNFGYIITEGYLEGFDTSAGNAGDPMWLGPTGNIIYGLANKPFGNSHLVYLGIVLRSNQNNGRAYVKVQNGFELAELHNVYATTPQNKDALLYNSGSGAWISRQITTGDVSGINNFYLASNPSGFVTGSVVRPSDTGVFYPRSNPSGFISEADLSNFVTGDVVRPSQTGEFITNSQTGAFYPANNPSGFLPYSGASENLNLGIQNISANSGSFSGNLAVDSETLFVDSVNKKVGVGTSTPTSSLSVAGGDIEVQELGYGFIIKSPNNTRFRITINNSGALITTQITGTI